MTTSKPTKRAERSRVEAWCPTCRRVWPNYAPVICPLCDCRTIAVPDEVMADLRARLSMRNQGMYAA